MKKEFDFYDQQTIIKWAELNCKSCFRTNCFAKKMIDNITYTNYLTERCFDFIGYNFMGSVYDIERKVCRRLIKKQRIVNPKKKKFERLELTTKLF